MSISNSTFLEDLLVTAQALPYTLSVMFAIVDIAGFQEKVAEGEKLRVPTLRGDPGSKVVFDKVFLIAKSDSDVKVGTPVVSGAIVEAKVIAHGKADKIRVTKMKRRKRYRRTYGHRQGYTEIEVTKISSSAKATVDKKATGGAQKEVKESKEEKEAKETKKKPVADSKANKANKDSKANKD